MLNRHHLYVQGYREDLAFIHDDGFRDFAVGATPGLHAILRKHGIKNGLVVDLGCGSGRWARELTTAGHQVLGVDQSPAMIRLARGIAPGATFRAASLWSAELPQCDAVTSLGECLNYTFDRRNSRAALRGLFRRVFRSLRPGGVFIFDIAEPARIPDGTERKWSEGNGWTILVEIDGDRARHLLRRRIVCFRCVGNSYRRSEELHVLRLYRANDLIDDLHRAGFQARRLAGYGSFRLPPGITGILAVKPISDKDVRASRPARGRAVRRA